MKYKFAFLMIITLLSASSTFAQRLARGERGDRQKERFSRVDTNKNGAIERAEFDADVDAAFKDIDKNGDGAIDENELPKPPLPPRFENGAMPPPPVRDAGRNNERFGDARGENRPPMPPPFLMRDADGDGRLTRAEFDENARRHFARTDKNGDGAISRDEADEFEDGGFRPPRDGVGFREPRDGKGFQPPPPPAAPTVAFLGAEMRFGDKSVKGAPFSAETVMESTRRLFDGSIVTAQNKGAIYRDGAGRTRREQTLETVGGFSLGAEAQQLVFITDAAEDTQYFLDPNRKTARRIPLGGNRPPSPPNAKSNDGKTESLGTKVLEGVSVEGTKTSIEIPAGNGKTVQVVTERWFSPELQIVVMTRHVDPFVGEQIFRLTNIKRGEPARELFAVPSDYKIEGGRAGNREE